MAGRLGARAEESLIGPWDWGAGESTTCRQAGGLQTQGGRAST